MDRCWKAAAELEPCTQQYRWSLTLTSRNACTHWASGNPDKWAKSHLIVYGPVAAYLRGLRDYLLVPELWKDQ